MRNEAGWTRNIRKKKRNTGQAYVTSRGMYMPVRKVLPPCGLICRFKCTTKLTETFRKEINERYWKIGDINRQREFISRHMEDVFPKYARKLPGSNRGTNKAFYFINDEGAKIRVCKLFFLSTLHISSTAVATTVHNKDSDGNLLPDKRGRYERGSFGRAVVEAVNIELNPLTSV